MRIVHIITRFIRGGADENTQITCNHQAQAGEDVTLIVGAEWSEAMRSGLDPRVRFITFSSLVRTVSPGRDLAALVKLYRIFKVLRPDIVHTHTSKAGIVGRIAARLARVPKIVHGVHILPFANVSPAATALYAWLERLCGRFTHAFIHVSPGMREECADYAVGKSALHVVAESGMDVARFRSASPPEDADALLQSPIGAAERPFVLVMIAALEERKGQRRFLRTFKEIVSRKPNAVLLMAGEGKEREKLASDIVQLGLESHVRILGYRSDPERLLSIADATLICSEREGLPRVAVQAAIARVPIITTALPGIDIIVRHGFTGFVVPLGDHALMKNFIFELMEKPDRRNAMKASLSEMDFSAWEARAMTDRIHSTYEMVGKGAAAS